VKVGAVATPLASVQAVVDTTMLTGSKEPLAALDTMVVESIVYAGAAKVTTAFGTGFGGVLPSITVTDSGAKGVPTATLWGVPELAVIVAGLIVFDRSNVVVDERPEG
jgi:hypothetical protein